MEATESLASKFPRHHLHAVSIGQHLALRPLQRASVPATNPLTIEVSGGGYAILFRFGVIVFVDVAQADQIRFLDGLEMLIREPTPGGHSESLDVEVREGAWEGFEDDVLHVGRGDLPILQLIADVLAKSVVLDEYERRLSTTFDRVEPIAESIQEGRFGMRRARELTRHIGETLRIQHRMVGRAEVGERPEILWDHPDLERLFQRLEQEYEIGERSQALDGKLRLISDTAATMLDLLQTQRTLRVEWYIVILIVVEIALTVYEMFVRHAAGA